MLLTECHARTRNRRLRIALGVAAAIATILLMFESWRDIVMMGIKDEETGHVLLVPLVVVWLVWVRRGRFARWSAEPSWLGVVFMAVGWFCWSFGYRYHNTHTLWHGGAILAALGAFLSFVGKGLLRKVFPAVAVLVFMIPVAAARRHAIASPLQTATATVTQAVCETLGMHVDRSMNLLMINGHDVAVAEACNGMRMVLTLFMVCYVMAFTSPLHMYVRILVVAASPLVAVCCNVIRLTPTVWMYGNASREAATKFHDVSGWVMLFVAFFVLSGIVKVLKWARLPIGPYTLAAA
jgi:exosortase